MLRQQIIDQMKEAMRARDTMRLSVMRYILSEIKNQEIDAKHELTDEEVIGLLRKESKRRREAVSQFEQGGRADLVEKEQAELKYIEVLLPEEMGVEELEKIVDQVLATGETNFGLIMRAVMEKAKGQADGKMVSEMVKRKLGS